MGYKDPGKHRDRIKARNQLYYTSHPETRGPRQRAYRQALFAEALRVLGNKCACPGCDEAEPRFLTVDHIYGRARGGKRPAILDAKASGWDKTKFQILCWNCNMTKSDRGFCPVHQKDPGQRNGHHPISNIQGLLWPSRED